MKYSSNIKRHKEIICIFQQPAKYSFFNLFQILAHYDLTLKIVLIEFLLQPYNHFAFPFSSFHQTLVIYSPWGLFYSILRILWLLTTDCSHFEIGNSPDILKIKYGGKWS